MKSHRKDFAIIGAYGATCSDSPQSLMASYTVYGWIREDPGAFVAVVCAVPDALNGARVVRERHEGRFHSEKQAMGELLTMGRALAYAVENRGDTLLGIKLTREAPPELEH